jgi:hypothetical protein
MTLRYPTFSLAQRLELHRIVSSIGYSVHPDGFIWLNANRLFSP